GRGRLRAPPEAGAGAADVGRRLFQRRHGLYSLAPRAPRRRLRGGQCDGLLQLPPTLVARRRGPDRRAGPSNVPAAPGNTRLGGTVEGSPSLIRRRGKSSHSERARPSVRSRFGGGSDASGVDANGTRELHSAVLFIPR